MAAVRIALERLLHQQRQPVEPLAHVGMAGCQPHPAPGRQRDHRCRPGLASTRMMVLTTAASADPLIRTREPFARSTSIRLPAKTGSAAIRTAAKLAVGCEDRTSSRRQPYSWLE